MTLNYLGYMLADRGVKLDGAAMLQKAVQLDPQNYAYLDSLGWVYMKLGQYRLAEENLRQASERGSTTLRCTTIWVSSTKRRGVCARRLAMGPVARTICSHSARPMSMKSDVNKVQKKLENAKVKLAANPHRPLTLSTDLTLRLSRRPPATCE